MGKAWRRLHCPVLRVIASLQCSRIVYVDLYDSVCAFNKLVVPTAVGSTSYIFLAGRTMMCWIFWVRVALPVSTGHAARLMG